MTKRKAKPAPVVQLVEMVKADGNISHIFAAQASQLRTGVQAAQTSLQGYLGEVLLKKWMTNPIAPEAPTPIAAIKQAADMAQAYGEQGTDRIAAERLFSQLERSRDALSLAALGKVVSDVELRNSKKASSPAKALAEVLTRACRVVNDICDNGKVPAAKAAAMGRRLSNRQVIQSVCS